MEAVTLRRLIIDNGDDEIEFNSCSRLEVAASRRKRPALELTRFAVLPGSVCVLVERPEVDSEYPLLSLP